MFDEIRFRQYYNNNSYNSVSSSFQIDLTKKMAKFKEYDYPSIDELTEKFPDIQGAITFKQQTEDKIDKIFKLNKNQIDLILNEIDNLRCTDFGHHGYRINENITYKIELFKDNYIEEYININLKYKEELIKVNQALLEIFSFPIFDLSFLNTVITEHDYDITRSGVYSKDTLEKMKLKSIHFSIEAGMFVFYHGWTLDFEKKILRFEGETYKLTKYTIDTINKFIYDYGVYNWFYPDYYEKIAEEDECGFDTEAWMSIFIFEDGKQLTIRESDGYPDTYPQLAFKIKETFGKDLLKSEFPDNLKLYHKYGDHKIKSNKKSKYIKDYIISEIVLKVPGILDYHIIDFPKTLYKKEEIIFEYDSVYEDELYHLKETIISKLKECYDFLSSKYDFYVILYPFEYLKNLEVDYATLIGSDKKIKTINYLEKLNQPQKEDYLLELWEKNKWWYLEFKHFCYEDNLLGEYPASYDLDSKYILSNSYNINQNELQIYLKVSGYKYNIAEKEEATEVLIQKFDSRLNLISEEIHYLND